MKYFSNPKNSFSLSDFAKHLEKPFYSTKESYDLESNLRFATITIILQSSFFSVFPVLFNLNVAKLNSLRLLLNRYQSLCQKGFARILTLTLKALSFFLPVQHFGVFSIPLCKIRSRHPRKLKFTGLIASVMFYKLSKFESLTIINDVIMTSLPKTMGKCGILH